MRKKTQSAGMQYHLHSMGYHWQKTKSGILVPAKPRPIFPFKMSTSATGRAQQGTTAFIPDATEKNASIAQWRRNTWKWIRNEEKKARERGVPADVKINQVEQVKRRMAAQLISGRRGAAREAEFFMKRTTPLQRKIARMLARAKIPVEQSIQRIISTVTKKGTPRKRVVHLNVLRRGEFVPIVDRDKPVHVVNGKSAIAISTQIRRIMARMHALGITHNHPHINNFVINSKDKVKLLDLSMARYYRTKPKNKEEFVQRFGRDIYQAAEAIIAVKLQVPGTKWVNYEDNLTPLLVKEITRLIIANEWAGNPTFNTNASDILAKMGWKE